MLCRCCLKGCSLCFQLKACAVGVMLFCKPCWVYSWLLIQPEHGHTHAALLSFSVCFVFFTHDSLLNGGGSCLWTTTHSCGLTLGQTQTLRTPSSSSNPLFLSSSVWLSFRLVGKEQKFVQHGSIPVRNPLSSFSLPPNTCIPACELCYKQRWWAMLTGMYWAPQGMDRWSDGWIERWHTRWLNASSEA